MALKKQFSRVITEQKGFTLIEVLSALAILIIIITSLFTIFINTMNYTANNKDKIQAVYAGRNVATAVKQSSIGEFVNFGIPISQLGSSSEPIIINNQDMIRSLLSIDEPDYDIMLELRPGPSGSGAYPELVEVTVIVTHESSTELQATAKTFAYLK